MLRVAAQLIATPNGFATDGPTGVSDFGGSGPLVRVDELDQAKSITATVDAIIFDDGQVVGPDESGLVNYINATHAGIKNLVRTLRESASRERLDEILQNMDSTRRRSSVASLRADPGLFRALREASFLLRMPFEQRMQHLDVLERLPEPPTFYR
jgi:hypothetical protein